MEVVQQVREHIKSKGSWDDLWKDGLTPWDLGMPTPLLVKELEQQRAKEHQPQSSTLRTLVPGCGSGHDLATLVDHHEAILKNSSTEITESVVIGLDIAPTSLVTASELVQRIKGTKTRVELKCGDFFSDGFECKTVYTSHDGTISQPTELFDFILDYTFFCALPPSLRKDWGERMSTLLRPNTGRLFTIIFPILPGEDRSKGPPYPITVDDYRESLEPVGIVMESEPFESPYTVPSRVGKELCCYWKLQSSDSKL